VDREEAVAAPEAVANEALAVTESADENELDELCDADAVELALRENTEEGLPLSVTLEERDGSEEADDDGVHAPVLLATAVADTVALPEPLLEPLPLVVAVPVRWLLKEPEHVGETEDVTVSDRRALTLARVLADSDAVALLLRDD